MEIIKCLDNTIEYIENNLDGTIVIDEVARAAFVSRYHFQRMFYALTGFTLSEYIRNRRLTLTGEELSYESVSILI